MTSGHRVFRRRRLRAARHAGSPDAPPRALVLIHPATAVPERLYAGFARFLTERGFAALTYNYRGIGASRPARLGALKAACATGWNST